MGLRMTATVSVSVGERCRMAVGERTGKAKRSGQFDDVGHLGHVWVWEVRSVGSRVALVQKCDGVTSKKSKVACRG